MIFIKKKHRYKPLYKKFLGLKKNVQNRRKILKFKKKKWEEFIFHIERFLIFRKKNFRMYDQNRYHIPKFNRFKQKYNNNLQTTKRFSLFYGNMLKRYLKKKVKVSIKKKKNYNLFLIKVLESRIDTVLYRSHFTLSIRNARQLISHKYVSVNNILVKNSSFILKKGDLIKINPKYHKLLDKNLGQSNLWPIPPKYLQINYKTFQIIFSENIEHTNLAIFYPFYLNVFNIIRRFSL